MEEISVILAQQEKSYKSMIATMPIKNKGYSKNSLYFFF